MSHGSSITHLRSASIKINYLLSPDHISRFRAQGNFPFINLGKNGDEHGEKVKALVFHNVCEDRCTSFGMVSCNPDFIHASMKKSK